MQGPHLALLVVMVVVVVVAALAVLAVCSPQMQNDEVHDPP
jgi:hypothetical protein